MHTFPWHNQTFTLMHDRAIYWQCTETAIVSDLHLGKAETFRRAGIPMPAGTTQQTLTRLSKLLEKTNASRLLILGDFLHAKKGVTDRLLRQLSVWRAQHSAVHITLVRGNHDRSAGDPPNKLGIEVVNEPMSQNKIAFCHDFTSCESDQPAMGGHIHPVFTLRDRAGRSVRAACFVVDDTRLLLPAFGSFTGGHSIKRLPGRRIFLTGPSEVIEVPSRVNVALPQAAEIS